MSPRLEIESDTLTTRRKRKKGDALPTPTPGKVRPVTPARAERHDRREAMGMPGERPWLHPDNPALWEGDSDDED